MSIFYEEEICAANIDCHKSSEDDHYTEDSFHKCNHVGDCSVELKEYTSIFHDEVITEVKKLDPERGDINYDLYAAKLKELQNKPDSGASKAAKYIGLFLTIDGAIMLWINAFCLLPLGVILGALEMYVGDRIASKSKAGALADIVNKCNKDIKQLSQYQSKTSDPKEKKKCEECIVKLEKLRDETQKYLNRVN